MKLKISLKQPLLVAVLTGLVALSPVFLIYFISKISIHRESSPLVGSVIVPPRQEQENLPISVGEPMRLKIPNINVDSVVEYVALDSDGAMDVPKNRDNVGWFELGLHPGENGSAVIAGHYGIKDGKGSVFDNLHKLRKGDKIYTEDDKGVIISFVVRETRRYDPKADASDIFSSSDGKAHLNLVTCEGVWDETAQQYSKRLVVFTDKEIE